MKSVGIDIGSSSIKVVEASATNRGVQLLSFREFPLGTNPAFDQEIEILDILKGLANEYDPTRTRIVIGLRQDYISVRLKLFPFSERQKILKSLPFELEEELPFSSETAIYDARVSQYIGNQAEILAVVAPKIRIQALAQQVRDAGLNVAIMSAEGLALSNCFENWMGTPPVSAVSPAQFEEDQPRRIMQARLHIGHTHTLVLAYENDHLIGIRSVLWGAKNVADAISRRYEIPYVEALSEMRKKAFILANKAEASYDQILFSDTIAGQVRELGKEVKISLMEFESELHGEFDSMELSGGFSQTLNLHAFLTTQLEIPVNRSSVLANFTTLFEKSPTSEAVVGVALGLALEGLRRPKNPAIQFLRQEFAKQGEGFAEIWKTYGSSAQFVGILFLIFFVYSNLRETFSEDLSEKVQEAMKKQAKEVAGLPAKQAGEASIRKYISAQRKRVQEVKEIESVMHMNTSLDILKKLSDATPGHSQVGLTIRKLQIIDTQVKLEGIVAKREEVKTIENALRSVARGQVSSSIGNSLPGQTSVAFTMVFDVDRGIQAVSR